MRPPLDLELPRAERWPRLAIGASVVAHAILLLVVLRNHWIPQITVPAEAPIVLQPMPPFPGARTVTIRPPRLLPKTERLAPRPPAQPVTSAPAPDQPAAMPQQIPAVAPPAVVDTGSRGLTAERIAPGLGRGKLWVQPLPLPPKELAQRLQRSHVQLADSAVTATIQAFLDSIAADPASRLTALPSWTTTVAGKKFGLDGRNIYVAGLKIPAAVLALLRLPPGNESKAFDRSSWLYDDLRIAAQRSANMEDFKREIREIRARTQEQRDFQRNQRTPPPKENEQ